jgi:glycosyltransferase involved in cell wall biosynthesis
MESDTNIDAMDYFVSDIWPEVIAGKSEVKLKIIGKNPPDSLKDLTRKDDRIEVTGYVENIPAEMSKFSIFVVPLRIGSGTRIKILEAMALGLPVVSTSIGAEGLDVRHEENILIADSPADFAEAVKRLMDDGDFRFRLGSAGRNLVMERYEWESIADRLEKELTGLVERGPIQ